MTESSTSYLMFGAGPCERAFEVGFGKESADNLATHIPHLISNAQAALRCAQAAGDKISMEDFCDCIAAAQTVLGLAVAMQDVIKRKPAQEA